MRILLQGFCKAKRAMFFVRKKSDNNNIIIDCRLVHYLYEHILDNYSDFINDDGWFSQICLTTETIWNIILTNKKTNNLG